MLDEKRVREAERNVKMYLEDSLLWKNSSFRQEILGTYIRNYQESLNVAEDLFQRKLSNLWVVVVSYYAMYYIANAVLYKTGYKIGPKVSHKVTADALIVFIRAKLKKSLLDDYEEAKQEALELTGKITDEIIENFNHELEKRAFFQYESTEEIKVAKAQTSLDRAKRFVFEFRRLLS